MEEENKIKQKQTILMIIGIAILLVSITGITFAFFNYTRTGGANIIKTGNIEFNMTQGKTINLQNVFPITSEQAQADNSNTSLCEIVITGRNTYAGGVEYLVSTTDVHNLITRDSKPLDIPVSLLIDVTSNGAGANDNLGTEDNNYFTNRDEYTTSHYKKLAKGDLVDDQMVLVGFIASSASNNNSINGKITIRAYIDDEDVIITDTPDETDTGNKIALSTTEWLAANENGISFKIKVEANEGLWVNMPLYELMQKDAVLDNIQSNFVDSATGIDFSQPSSYTENETVINNGKGLYKMASTANDDYPIVYYRGDIDNNNVVFANKCWKMVRTTDTGGVKLLYNGEYSEKFNTTPLQNENDYTIVTNSGNPFTWNDTTKTFDVSIQNKTVTELSFIVPEGDDYILEVTGTTGGNGNGTLEIYNGNDLVKSYYGGYGGPIDLSSELGNLTTSDTIKVTYTAKTASATNYTNLSVKMAIRDESLGNNCDNLVSDSILKNDSQSRFYFSTIDNKNGSPVYSGYMYGIEYQLYNEKPGESIIFGSGYIYENNEYKLIGTGVGASATRHYTCNSKDEDATCQNIRYYYIMMYEYTARDYYYYFELSNGKSIEDALLEMQVNETSSNAKNVIDSWYATNIATSNANTSKLEDTIWCNDRSISDLGGFNPNGGLLSGHNMQYSSYDRIYNTHSPSLGCINQNDAFTVNNGKGNRDLTYPVALLTADEMIMSGAAGRYSYNGTIFAYDGNYYWSMSPSYYNGTSYMFSFRKNVECNSSGLSNIRPSLSIKNGVGFKSGTGTVTDPYIIDD